MNPDLMPLVYIIGHYRGPGGPNAPRDVIERNTMAALEADDRLHKAGIVGLVPHTQSLLADPDNRRGDAWWLKATERMMLGCSHAVVLSRGSEGTENEIRLAADHGIPVFDSLDECIEALGRADG